MKLEHFTGAAGTPPSGGTPPSAGPHLLQRGRSCDPTEVWERRARLAIRRAASAAAAQQGVRRDDIAVARMEDMGL